MAGGFNRCVVLAVHRLDLGKNCTRSRQLRVHRTRLAYKPEHAVDLDTGAILAAEVHPGDAGDTQTLEATLEGAGATLAALDLAPAPGDPAEVIAGQRLSRPRRAEATRRRPMDHPDRRAGRRPGRADPACGLCERAFAHVLDRGGMRRTWLRGRDNVAKRYLIHVAGHNLGLLMRILFGAGTPRAAADLRLFWLAAGDHLLLVLFAPQGTGTNTPPAAIAIITVTPHNDASSTGC